MHSINLHSYLVRGVVFKAKRLYAFCSFSDFPLAVKCNCGLFADDCILHWKVTSESDCEDLQIDLHSAYDWCNSWLVTLKSEKSKVLHLSRSKDPYHHEYGLSDKPLSAVDHHKHLVVSGWSLPCLGITI